MKATITTTPLLILDLGIVDCRFLTHELYSTTTPNPSLHRRGNGLENNHDIAVQRILPLCKGEPEGVVSVSLYGWNLKFKI